MAFASNSGEKGWNYLINLDMKKFYLEKGMKKEKKYISELSCVNEIIYF